MGPRRLAQLIDDAVNERMPQRYFQATVVGQGTDINGTPIPNQIAIQRTGESVSDRGSYRVAGGYPGGVFNLQIGDTVSMKETSPGNILCEGQVGV